MGFGRACATPDPGAPVLPQGRSQFLEHRGVRRASQLDRPGGAWLAGFFFSLFGRPAYLFPMMLAHAGLVGAQGTILARRAVADQYAAAVGGFRAHLADELRARDSALGRGGIPQHGRRRRGEFVGTNAEHALSFLGATLLLLALWLSGVALFLGVSWFEIMDRLGAWVLRGIDWVVYPHRAAPRTQVGPGAQAGPPGSGARGPEEGRNRPPPRIERWLRCPSAASASSASGKCRCSMRRNRASCPLCPFWMNPARASSPTPTRPSRRCPAWWRSSCAISASRPR